MPKVTWIKPKVNELAALFRTYRNARHMTSTQIAEKIGCTPQNARVQMNIPARSGTSGSSYATVTCSAFHTTRHCRQTGKAAAE